MLVKFPRVAIVILNWNNVTDTLECLASVQRLDYPNFSIIVVDNGSKDDSVATIRHHYPDVSLIVNDKNLGFAQGNNVGIQKALADGADYVFLLNNDTVIEKHMLSRLVAAAESNSLVGIVGPTVYCTNPENTLFSAGSFVSWTKGSLCHRGLFQSTTQYAGLRSEQVDFIVGCGVLAKREMIESIGGLNPEYYLNFEDAEWGIEARRHGFQVWYIPQAIMCHKVNASLGRASPANTYYMTRNAMLFFRRNAPCVLKWFILMRIGIRTLRTIGAWTFKPQYHDQFFRRKRDANMYALRDFVLGRYGKMGPDVEKVCYGPR